VKTFYALSLSVALFAGSLFAQTNTLYSTTLSASVLAADNLINVTSATNMVAPSPASANPTGSRLYIVAPGTTRGESMAVAAISGTAITVVRGKSGARTDFPNGSMILFGPANWFKDYDPSGGCTAANTYSTPYVNVLTGSQWLCSTITLSWVPGWQNDVGPVAVTAAVASAAGQITPSGQLFHVTGTAAITGFTMPVGWNGGGFCIIPDGAFTTTATNNIAKASTAVVNRPLCFMYDATNSLFVPSY
jgi:hypothetical protein